jgi:PEP-CTERM motif
MLPSPPNNFPDPNYVFYDLLLTFTTPVTSVNVTSDDFSPEAPDVIRLLALQATATPGQFNVLAFDQKTDDAVAPPANLLSVSLGGNSLSHALIEVISENEGFDNVTFTPIPEPATLWLLLAGTLTMCCRRRPRVS